MACCIDREVLLEAVLGGIPNLVETRI